MILLFLSILSPLFPIVCGTIRKRNSLLVAYSIAGMLTDILIFLLKRVLLVKYLWLANLFGAVECCFIFFYYKNKVFRSDTLFFLLLSSVLLFFLSSTTFIKGWPELNRMGISVHLVIYIILSITGFYSILKEQKIPHLEQSSFFWVNVAILVYSSGAFFLFLGADTVRAIDKQLMAKLWGTLFLSLNILKNILLGIALSKKADT